MSTSRSRGGITCPWQRGQSGQPSPDSVMRTDSAQYDEGEGGDGRNYEELLIAVGTNHPASVPLERFGQAGWSAPGADGDA